jgi:hypothetical protein
MSDEKRTPLDLGPMIARYRTGTYAVPIEDTMRDCRWMLFEIEETREQRDELRDKLGRVLDLTTWDDGERREDVSVDELLHALGEVAA